MKYDKLIKDLRICASTFTEPCEECSHTEAGDRYNKLKRNAADAIEELQKQLREEHAKNLWIPVTERLPETDKCVLVISYGRVCYARLLKSGNNGSHPEFILQDGLSNMLRQPVIETTAHNKFTRNRITHWMPLPEPPKEEKDG